MKNTVILLVFLFCLSAQAQVLPAPPRINYEREIFNTALELGSDSLTARMIVAQAKHESGNFNNGLTVHHNNVFSMQHPKRRPTTSLGALATAEKRPNKYASYKSVRDAVIDLFFYFATKKINVKQPSIEVYVRTLKQKRFFEESYTNYKTRMKKHFNKLTV